MSFVALHLIAALWLGSHTGSPSLPAIDGSYVTRTLNGHPLPADLRVPAAAGAFRLFRLEQGVLRLAPAGKFTLYFRYYHQLVPLGSRPSATPVMSESETGNYSIKGNQLTLVPSRARDGRSRPTITAVVSGTQISASYVLHDGARRQRVSLVLERDPTYW